MVLGDKQTTGLGVGCCCCSRIYDRAVRGLMGCYSEVAVSPGISGEFKTVCEHTEEALNRNEYLCKLRLDQHARRPMK